MPKLLGEFLQEQQEPFALDVYLLERGCFTHLTQDSTRFMNRCGGRMRKQAIPSCATIVRAAFSRLVSNNHIKNDLKRREEDEFPSASATTFYHSCSETDVEDDADCTTESSSFSLELSPDTVLEETECPNSPLHKKQHNFRRMQSYKCKSKISTHKFNGHDQYSINKRSLQQKKQLLIDCVREVIENQRKRDDETGQQLKKILGAEELWKLVCENVWLWSQDSIDETNIIHLLKSDFMAYLEEWSSASDQQKNEIAMEIGDAILEDVVNEIVTC